MSRIFSCILILVINGSLLAQQLPDYSNVDMPPLKNTLYLEVGGSFVWLGGINYERIIYQKEKHFSVFRVGLGLDLWNNNHPAAAVPIGATFNFGKDDLLEIGFSATFSASAKKITKDLDKDVSYDWMVDLGLQPILGYRFQKKSGGTLFRATLTTLPIPVCINHNQSSTCNTYQFALWFGLSGGILF